MCIIFTVARNPSLKLLHKIEFACRLRASSGPPSEPIPSQRHPSLEAPPKIKKRFDRWSTEMPPFPPFSGISKL